MIIIGIDPGSIRTGYGIIRKTGQQLEHIASGVIHVKGGEVNGRLPIIFTQLQEIIAKYQPDQFVIEQVFLADNPQTALKLGMARGIAILAGSLAQLPIFELSARQAKKFVTGMGAAEKKQVNRMVCKILRLDHAPQIDASDALAIAISHAKTIQTRINIAQRTSDLVDQRTAKRLAADQQNLQTISTEELLTGNQTQETITDNLSLNTSHNVIRTVDPEIWYGNMTHTNISNNSSMSIVNSIPSNITHTTSNQLDITTSKTSGISEQSCVAIDILAIRVAQMQQELQQLAVVLPNSTNQSIKQEVTVAPTTVTSSLQSDIIVPVTGTTNTPTLVANLTNNQDKNLILNSNITTDNYTTKGSQNTEISLAPNTISTSLPSLISTHSLFQGQHYDASTCNSNSSCSHNFSAVLEHSTQSVPTDSKKSIIGNLNGITKLDLEHRLEQLPQQLLQAQNISNTTMMPQATIPSNNFVPVDRVTVSDQINNIYTNQLKISEQQPIIASLANSTKHSPFQAKLNALVAQNFSSAPNNINNDLYTGVEKKSTCHTMINLYTDQDFSDDSVEKRNYPTTSDTSVIDNLPLQIQTHSQQLTTSHATSRVTSHTVSSKASIANNIEASHLVNFKINNRRFNVKTGKATNRSHLEQKIKQTLHPKTRKKS